jgi:hypothetical protein
MNNQLKIDRLKAALSFIEEAESSLYGIGDIDYLEEQLTKVALAIEAEIADRQE